MSDYDVLGKQIVSELESAEILGASFGGFDVASLFNAAGEIVNKGIDYKQSQDAAAKTKADQGTALAKAIAADAAWANAEQVLDIANQSKDANRIAAAQALQQSDSSEAMNAGTSQDSDSTSKRVEAAQNALNNASQNSVSNPNDKAKAALVRAWQKVVSRAAVAPSGGGNPLSHFGGSGGTSWFTKVHGGIPTWGWMAGGAVTLTGLILLIRALRK